MKLSDIDTTNILKPPLKNLGIVESFPDEFDSALMIGCGECEFDRWLIAQGVPLTSVDIVVPQDTEGVNYHQGSILDLDTIPCRADVVIASEVIEHVHDRRTAYTNLLQLFRKRLIITVPWRRSFGDPGHLHFWDDFASEEYLPVTEFVDMTPMGLGMTIRKILTKEKDVQMKQRAYLIVVERTDDES